MSSSASRFPDCTSMNVNSEIALTACLTPFLIVIVSPLLITDLISSSTSSPSRVDKRPDFIAMAVYLIADTLTGFDFQLLGK